MFSNMMNCESKTKSKSIKIIRLSYSSSQKFYNTENFFFFKVMFLKEIYNYIRFMCSNIHSSILGIYNLTKKKEVNLVKEKKQKRKVPPNISRWMALQALSFVHSATSRFLFLLSLCNNKPLHSTLQKP